MPTSTETYNTLNLGIEAARAGDKQKARELLTQVLARSPDHRAAMFWMAYVAPTPHESIQILERILTLEPDSKPARAGLQWARERLAAQSAAQARATTPDEHNPAGNNRPPQVDRQQLLSQQEIRKQSQKGVMAQRARRNINPFLVIWLILALGGLLVAGVWALALVPTDTLAAWLPPATSEAGPEAGLPAAPVETKPVALTRNEKQTTSPHFSTQTDIIPGLRPAVSPNLPERAERAEMDAAPGAPEVDLTALTVPDFPLRPGLTTPADTRPATAPFELVGPLTGTLIGPELFVPVDAAELAYQPASPDEKWIEVDLSEQLVVAWEGNTPVMSFLSSTGLENTPTVQGQYHIYWKLESTVMAGPGYYLPDVPYTMYFFGGYALHGAYWHDDFGQPMSHGCVNLSPDNSKILFEWADPVIPPGQTQVVSSADNPGTLVVVHE